MHKIKTKKKQKQFSVWILHFKIFLKSLSMFMGSLF